MQEADNRTVTTNIEFSDSAREKLYAGVKKAAEAVTCTLGPKGKTVLVQNTGHAPVVTKDGVTVSKSICLKDPIERMGAELVREAASQTNDIAGDGTTTATALTYALITEGMKRLSANYEAKDLCAGIEAAHRALDVALCAASTKLVTYDTVKQVGTISANNDEQIGQLIADALQKVGPDGVITVEDAKGLNTSLAIVEGMQVDRGYLSSYFVTNTDRMIAAYDNAAVFVTDKKINNLRDIVPLLEHFMNSSRTPLLIIAEDVEGDALSGLVLNRSKGNLPVVAIKAPGYGQHRTELLKDICVLTGATLVSSATGVGFDKAAASCGRLKRFVCDAKSTTLIGTGSTDAALKLHLDDLRVQLTDVTASAEDIVKLKTRVARLSSGVAVIKVGGATEIEMIERKYRIEDALNATRAAVEEGIVPGGGTALYDAVRATRGNVGALNGEEAMGWTCLMEAALYPMKKIIQNANENPGVVLAALDSKRAGKNMGYNAATGVYEDLIAAGVIDPVKVTRTALKHAVSVAMTFINLGAVVYEDNK